MNYSFFEEWNRPMAYYLGYVFADASIQIGRKGSCQLHLECHTEDESVILELREALKSLHSICRRPAKRTGKRNCGPSTRVGICGRPLVDSLMRKGVLPQKSHLNGPFPEVPEEYLPDFVRGYHVGDGSIHSEPKRVHFSLSGGLQFIEGMKVEILKRLRLSDNTVVRVSPLSDTYRVKWSSYEDLMRIQAWIYPEGDYPFLFRKRKILEDYLHVGET